MVETLPMMRDREASETLSWRLGLDPGTWVSSVWKYGLILANLPRKLVVTAVG